MKFLNYLSICALTVAMAACAGDKENKEAADNNAKAPETEVVETEEPATDQYADDADLDVNVDDEWDAAMKEAGDEWDAALKEAGDEWGNAMQQASKEMSAAQKQAAKEIEAAQKKAAKEMEAAMKQAASAYGF